MGNQIMAVMAENQRLLEILKINQTWKKSQPRSKKDVEKITTKN